MKRYILIFSLLWGSTAALAQVKVGLQVSPTLSFNRVSGESDNLNFSSNGIGARILAGAIVDYMIGENYFVSSGAFFVPKRVGLRDGATEQVEEAYKLHYLQIPATMKLFTNEVALDTRIYFQGGVAIDIKLKDDKLSDEVEYVDDFGFIDGSLLLATGAEYRYGYNTILFGGFSYRRGLGNVVRNATAPAGDLIIKNDLFSLDVGIKF